MNNSKKNRFVKILFPVVILIWAYVGYTIFDAFNSDNNSQHTPNIASTFIKPKIQKKEVFQLELPQSDPFLGTIYKKSKKGSLKKKPTLKNDINWPKISYQGTVSGGANAIFIVSINGKEHLLSKGDIVDKIKLVKGSKENITIQFEKQTKQFPIMCFQQPQVAVCLQTKK